MSNHKITTGNAEFYLLKIDASGYPINYDLIDVLCDELKDVTKNYTDVIILSHGWNAQPLEDGSDYIGKIVFEQLENSRPLERRPLYMQIQWPSAVVRGFEKSEDSDEKEKFMHFMKELRESLNRDDSIISDKKQSCLVTIDDAERNVGDFMDKCSNESATYKTQLPENVIKSVVRMANELENESGLQNQDRSISDVTNTDKITETYVEKRYQEQRYNRNPLARFFGFLLKPIVNPGKAMLYAIYDIIFLVFERRAAVVGSRGVHLLVSSLMKVAEKQVRFHICGHSMGAQVAMSSVIGHSPRSTFTRKIHSLLILQGTAPSVALSKGSVFRPIASRPRPVAGPILNTYWKDDKALIVMDIFSPRPLGRFGFEKTRPIPKKQVVLLKRNDGDEAQIVEFRKGMVYNLEISSVITDHNDVADKEIFELFWQAAVIEMEESDYYITKRIALPEGYWHQKKLRNKMENENLCFRG